MTSVENQKKHLTKRLDELNERLRDIDGELVSHNSRDSEELAVERETDEVLEGLGLSGQQEIRAINAALARIEAGEYGLCVTCGAAVSQERLDALPYTPFCRDCAAKNAEKRR